MRSSNKYLNRRISSLYDFPQTIRIIREDKICVRFGGRKKKIPVQPPANRGNIGRRGSYVTGLIIKHAKEEFAAGCVPQHNQGKQYETEGYQNVGTNQAAGYHKRIVYNFS